MQILADYLKRHDFEVTMGVANLPTAFVGRYKGNNGAPNLGVILEYDALRGTQGAFHGDQHSTQGPIGMAAAIAMAEYLERTHAPGSVVVYGTPGEEMMPPDAKTDMFKAGVFNGADVIVRSHCGERDHAARAGIRHLLPEHRRRQVHVLRRAGAPDDSVGRAQCARSRHPPVQQHRCGAHHHAAGSAHPGRDHRGRGRAQRGARPHRRPISTSAIRTRSTWRRCARPSTTPPAPPRWPPAPR